MAHAGAVYSTQSPNSISEYMVIFSDLEDNAARGDLEDVMATLNRDGRGARTSVVVLNLDQALLEAQLRDGHPRHIRCTC